jgi:hypothetical protein
VTREPGDRALEERHRAVLALVGERAWRPGPTAVVGPERRADRRDRHGQLTRERRAAQALAPRALAATRGRHLASTALRRRAAVDQRCRPAGAIARASDKPAVPTLRRRRLPTPPSSQVRHPLHRQASTLRHRTRILVPVPGRSPAQG